MKFKDIKIDNFFWHKNHLWMKCSHVAAKCRKYGACNFTTDPDDEVVGKELELGDIETMLMGGVKVKGSNVPNLKYNYDCKCGWLHLDVYPGFTCNNCGHIFDPKKDFE